MKRRDSIKTMLVTGLAGGAAIAGCEPTAPTKDIKGATSLTDYGRTTKEKQRDRKILEEQFFSENEIDVIATLCDLILPAEGEYKAATEADVPDFIEFMVKDMPDHQLPIRGGLMWLNNFANESFGGRFNSLEQGLQKELLDQIAYPEEVKADLKPGAEFFDLMRNLTLTGFYTTKLGIDEIGYKGNIPNVWDGVPDDILKAHGVSYDEEWLAKCVNQDTRNDLAKWDDEGNLIS